MSTDRDNPAGTQRLGRCSGQRRTRREERTAADQYDPERHLQRQGRFLVYTGPCEPFDAREAIEEVREERTP